MTDKLSKVETVTGVTFSEASFSFDKDTGRLKEYTPEEPADELVDDLPF